MSISSKRMMLLVVFPQTQMSKWSHDGAFAGGDGGEQRPPLGPRAPARPGAVSARRSWRHPRAPQPPPPPAALGSDALRHSRAHALLTPFAALSGYEDCHFSARSVGIVRCSRAL